MLLLCFIKQAGFSVLSMMMSRNKKTPLLLLARTTSFFFSFKCFPLSLAASPVSNPNSQKVVKKLAKFHKRKNPRLFVTHTRPFQIPNSTALVTTLPATANQLAAVEASRERERERERGKKTLKGKRKATTTTVGTFTSSFQATIMQKKDLKKQKKECSLSARKGRWNTRDFHKKKQRKKTKQQTRNWWEGKQKCSKSSQNSAQENAKRVPNKTRRHAQPRPFSPQSLLTFFFGCLPVLPDSHDDPHVFYVSSR